MIPSPRVAYAYARVRARKSHLLGIRDAMPLLAATDAATFEHARAAVGADTHKSFERLMALYALAIRSYRAPLFRALLGLHEIENVKLLWRVVANDRERSAIARLWRPLGAMAAVPMLIDAPSLRDLADALAKTPYGAIAANAIRSSGTAELLFDRWASQRLLAEARALPPREQLTRTLIESVVRERDAEIAARGAQWYGMSPAAVTASLAIDGELGDAFAMRRRRLQLCRRACIADPFLLAPAVAVILLAEEEVRSVRALIERRGDATLDEAAARAMAASQMGG